MTITNIYSAEQINTMNAELEKRISALESRLNELNSFKSHDDVDDESNNKEEKEHISYTYSLCVPFGYLGVVFTRLETEGWKIEEAVKGSLQPENKTLVTVTISRENK